MGLRERLSQQVATEEAEARTREEAEARTREEEEKRVRVVAEEERIRILQESVSSFDEKITRSRALLSQLQETNVQAQNAVGSAIEEKRKLATAISDVNNLLTDPRFKSILKAEGIISVNDLLQAGNYSDEAEVRDVNNLQQSKGEKFTLARERISSRRQVKNQVIEAITQDKLEIPQKMNYQDAVKSLETLITDLESERKKLYDQTPEGREALKKEIFVKIKTAYDETDQRNYTENANNKDLTSSRNIEAKNFVQHIEQGLVDQYGEEPVKLAIQEYFAQVIDDNIAKVADISGLTKKQAAVEFITGAENHWLEIERDFDSLILFKQQTIDNLATFFQSGAGQEAAKEIYKHYHGSAPKEQLTAEQALALAREHIDSESKGIAEFDLRFRSVDERNHVASLEEHGLKMVIFGPEERSFRERQSTVAGDLASQSEKFKITDKGLPDPSKIKNILDLMKQHYAKLNENIATPGAFLTASGDWERTAGSLSKNSATQDLVAKIRGTSNNVTFDKATTTFLTTNNFRKARSQVEQEQAELEIKRQALKEQVVAKVELDWQSEMLNGFRRQNRIDDIERQLKKAKVAEKLLPMFDVAISGLSEKLVFDQRYVSFEVLLKEDLQRLNSRISQLQTEIKDAQRVIANINQRADREGDGLFGGKKRAREEEKQPFTAKLESLSADLERAQADFKPKYDHDQELKPLRAFFSTNRSALEDLGVKIADAEFTPPELSQEIRRQMNFELNPEQTRVFNENQVLEARKTQAETQYQAVKERVSKRV